jgi:ketosteroid isomerase-like protein
MRTFSDAEWAEQIKGNVCSGSGSGESFVDAILVSVLSPDVATATMSYHAILQDAQGKTTNREGQIVRVFRRASGGWKIRVSMSTHSDLRK